MPGDCLALKAAIVGKYASTVSDADVAAALPVDFPTTIPKPFTATDVISALGAGAADQGTAQTQIAATVKNLRSLPGITSINEAILAQNRPGLVSAINLALLAGDVTQAQHDAVLAVLTATIPDPSTSVNVAGWNLPVTTADVTHARSL